MEMKFGEFVFRAVPLLIIAGVAALFFIIDRYLKSKYEDGPDYRDS